MPNNPSITNYDRSPLVIGEMQDLKGQTIVSGEDITVGMLLGVITASEKLAQSKSGSSDGSENPRYIAITNTDATGGDVTDVTVLATGKINAANIVFDGTDDLDTVVNNQSYYNHLRDYGIIAIPSTTLVDYDNQ
jgi:hypothetical protein